MTARQLSVVPIGEQFLAIRMLAAFNRTQEFGERLFECAGGGHRLRRVWIWFVHDRDSEAKVSVVKLIFGGTVQRRRPQKERVRRVVVRRCELQRVL